MALLARRLGIGSRAEQLPVHRWSRGIGRGVVEPGGRARIPDRPQEFAPSPAMGADLEVHKRRMSLHDVGLPGGSGSSASSGAAHGTFTAPAMFSMPNDDVIIRFGVVADCGDWVIAFPRDKP